MIRTKMLSTQFILLAWTGFCVFSISQGLQQTDLHGHVGETVDLPCSVTTEKCGDLHSIKWYRGSSRIYVFSEMANIRRSEGDYTDRAVLVYTPNSTESFLKVNKLQVSDEALYKCEITYLEVREGCQVVQFINLTTLIKPEYVKITKEDGSEVNNTMQGPLTEGDEIVLRCESGGGKPIPMVTWHNGTNIMQGNYEAKSQSNGIGTGINTISVRVSRGDLGVKYECQVHSQALGDIGTIKSWVGINVDVRPTKLSLTGVHNPVNQGDNITIQCLVKGAKPAANITWYNRTEAIPSTEDTIIQQQNRPITIVVQNTDGTSDTRSTLSFVASRHENDNPLSCEASNSIMRERLELPLREEITLEVLYPPIVNVSTINHTVNETQDVTLFCEYVANPATLNFVKWIKDNEELNLNSDHYEGGSTEYPTLKILNSTRHDQGEYWCELNNNAGTSRSTDSLLVSVYYSPSVRLTMDPRSPVREIDRLNISISCEVESGNPETLLSVIWYLDGEILKELPDCKTPNSTFCDVDPSKLLLENVERSFHGNYSCIGRNAAGWGIVSPSTELVVYYPPGPASLVYQPTKVVKKGSVTLTCGVEDPGRPDNVVYHWVRDSHPILGAASANYTIDLVTLETNANFSCTAVNSGGESDPVNVKIDVFAPPAFIERSPPYYGALMNAQHINISCRVECQPLCEIDWLKNGRKIESNSRYTIQKTQMPPDARTNDFASILSTLIWNMSAWPGNQLDRINDNANFTCESSSNGIGPAVRSSTWFVVEYPPENVTVSNKAVNVIEGNVPEKVLCSAKAFPEASYQWRKEDDPESNAIKGNALILNFPILRSREGNYVCEAFNRRGNSSQKTYINVLYKPECGITQNEVDGKIVLVCTAKANPPEVDFTWKIKNENETIEEGIENNGLKSSLTLETRVENLRTFLCYANNSVGMSIPCERDVTANVAWWRRLDNENIMVIIAVIAGTILIVIIICIIIIIVCRRKRAADKCPNPSATKDKSDLNSSPSDALLQPDADNKAFYENLPFHGMQNPPNKPFRPEFSDLDYADVDYASYGPINYKAASIFAAQKKNEPEELL